MKTLAFTFFLLVITISLYSQIEKINETTSKLFFGLSSIPNKHEVRSLAHSSGNFYDYDDIMSFGHSMNFKHNFMLNHTGSGEKVLAVWFKEGESISNGHIIKIRYTIDEFKQAKNQWNEIYEIFSSISFKTVKEPALNPSGNQMGETWYFYSSQNSYDNDDYYLDVDYWYLDSKAAGYKDWEKYEGYTVDIVLRGVNIY